MPTRIASAGVDVGGVRAQGRRDEPAGRAGRAGRRGEPAGDPEEHADDDHRGRDAGHQRGADRPGRFRRRLDAVFFDQLADDDSAGDLAGDDHREAGRDQADTAGEHGHPAALAREVDGEAEAEEGEQREDQRQALDRDDDVLRGLQLVGAQDRDLARVRRQLLGEVGADPDLVGEIGDEAAEVEADLAFFGRDRAPPFLPALRAAVRGWSGWRSSRVPARSSSSAPGWRRRRRTGAGRRRSARPAPWCRREAFRSVPFRRRRFRRAGRPGSRRPLRGSSRSGSGGRWCRPSHRC